MNILLSALSLGVLGLIFGILLAYAGEKFKVKVNAKIPEIREVLPGANCGGCGYAGCEAYAEAVVLQGEKANLCSIGGKALIEKISDILQVEVETCERKVAFIKCNGACTVAKQKYIAFSCDSCEEAAMMADGGPKGCNSGCLGLGSCIKVCEFGAIEIFDGIAKINADKCTACGACINICPKKLIEKIPFEATVKVLCNSKEFGKKVKEQCTVGCIGCGICSKNCTSNAISMIEKLAKIDYDKCNGCNICVSKCPTKAIKNKE